MKTIRGLIKFAVATGLRKGDPTVSIKLPSIKSDGHHTWGDDEILKFENRHPIGTRAGLALALLLYTGQRRGDIVRMGRQHVRDGVLSLRQQKTGAQIDIPVLPDLQTALDAMPVTDQLAFLTTEFGATVHSRRLWRLVPGALR